MLKRLLTLATDKIFNMPVLVLMPHSRCNCKCVMCDIWKANHNKKEISYEELERHVDEFKRLGVREVVLSGGEALMHGNLWKFCTLLNQMNAKLTLLSTGLLLEKNAVNVVEHFSNVIVSLDGSPAVHDRIRNIPDGFAKLANGVKALKAIRPDFNVSGRCVIQRFNFQDFIPTVRAAKAIGLNQISFLAADITTSAFNRPDHWNQERISDVALTIGEANQLVEIIKTSFTELHAEYAARFIAESPEKMMKIAQYYKAINGHGEYPQTICNAPWVSAVIESDGSVMPCFFHKPYGNIYDSKFSEIINSKQAIAFRRSLDVTRDQTCKKCVCSLKLGVTQMN